MLFISLFPDWDLNFRALLLFVVVDFFDFMPTALPDVLSLFFSLCGVFHNILDTFELSPSGNSDVIVLIFVVVIPAFWLGFCFKWPPYLTLVERHPVVGSLRSSRGA
jgi:hypothetical protein